MRSTFVKQLDIDVTILTTDVNFNENFDRIVASRFLLQGLKVDTSIKETEMVRELRKICENFSTEDFQVGVRVI